MAILRAAIPLGGLGCVRGLFAVRATETLVLLPTGGNDVLLCVHISLEQ